MISNSRKTVRNAFAALLVTALEGSGKLGQAVKSYRWGGIKGESPVIVVSSDGTSRKQLTFMGTVPTYKIQVDVFVLYNIPQDISYTEQTAEDLVDDIEQTIAAVIEANQRTANWDSITQTTPSVREDVTLGGVEYIREYYLLEFA
jgi:hypothetical protein